MRVVVAEDRELARRVWKERAGELPVEAVKLALGLFPGAQVESYTLADEEHPIPARERTVAAAPPRSATKKEWW